MIEACLNRSGTDEEASDVLTIFKRTGKSWSIHSFRIFVGIGSSGHDFVGASRMIFLRFSVVTGGKEVVYVQRWDPWYSYREKIQKIL